MDGQRSGPGWKDRVLDALPLLLLLAGTALLVVGAALAWPPAGWMVAGVACLVAGWRLAL